MTRKSHQPAGNANKRAREGQIFEGGRRKPAGERYDAAVIRNVEPCVRRSDCVYIHVFSIVDADDERRLPSSFGSEKVLGEKT